MTDAIAEPTTSPAIGRGVYRRERPAGAVGILRAVIYIRVSTSKQADTDLDPDGLSLPAQRAACHRKAEELGAVVIDEYMDRGESAKTADRPQFQEMLRRVEQDRDVDFVIVDKINRLARNRRDDANVLFEIRKAGAKLVSVKENVDDTPAGRMLHGMLAVLAEFESANNGTEALKGMTQKARVGGTPGRAPIGYLNVREHRHGSKRGFATVEIDQERAHHVRWAFEQYATGDWTTQTLTDALAARGLRTIATPKRPAKPLLKSRVAHMLSNPYYMGVVVFQGAQYEGRHEPLVSPELFARVGAVLKEKRHAVDKAQKHHHYLKGTLFCGQCGARLFYTRNRGHGGVYDYFKCTTPTCPVGHIRSDYLEAEVEAQWQATELCDEQLAALRAGLSEELVRYRRGARTEVEAATKRRDELEEERVALLRAHLAGAVPLELLKPEQDRIAIELEQARQTIDALSQEFGEIEDILTMAVSIMECASAAYRASGPSGRRRLNQAVFDRIEVSIDEGHHGVLASPFAELHQYAVTSEVDGVEGPSSSGLTYYRGPRVEGLNLQALVPPGGLEPPTHGLGMRLHPSGGC